MKHLWNERFAKEEYAYGKEPNQFFKEEIDKLNPGRLLLFGEGEGRNGIYAAKLGWEVDAVDWSDAAKNKAEKLADDNNVKINYTVADVSDYNPKENYYATIVDSCQSKFRLMMHEHSSLRAYCNSGILWSKTVDQFQVNKVLPPSVYHVLFTYKKGMATSFIDGNLNWTKSVADKPVNLSRFSLLQKCPSNKASGFGDKYVGEVESVVILDKSFTPEEVAKVFKNDVAENKMLGTELAVKYLLPWTLIFFLCWNLPNIMVFFEKGIGKKRTIELYILFIYAVMITLSIVYSFGTGIVKEINASLTGAFVASYTFWLIYCCFLSFYLVILYKLFRRPLLQAISCLYFITALLVYSLWLGTAKQLVPFWENLFIAICIATFMLIPVFNEDSK